jgi:hypothetical protein
MNIKEECSIDVPTAHLSKVSFIPTAKTEMKVEGKNQNNIIYQT